MTWAGTNASCERAELIRRNNNDYMFECEITLNNCTVQYQSDRDLISAFRKLSSNPRFRGLRIGQKLTRNRHIIRYVNSEKATVSYTRHTAVIEAPWASLREGETLVYAAFPFFELQRQVGGYVSAHAGAVSFPEGAILLLGKEGAGKTSTALTLCRSHGARLIGNDYVILGTDRTSNQIIVQGGIKSLHVRYESARRSMPELLPFFSNPVHDGWLKRALVEPSELDIMVENRPQPIKAAYLVHVNETQMGVFDAPADNLVNRLYLYENLSRYIRCSCISLLTEDLSFLGFVPSFDTEKLFVKRAELIERMFVDLRMTYVSGSATEVASYISSRLA